LAIHPALRRTSLSVPSNGDPASNVTEESDRDSAKHLSPETSTDEGRMILTKPLLKNSSSSIRDNLAPDSNVSEESDLHSEKHFSPKTSTDEGRMILTKSVLKNASFAIRDNLDSDSNVTEENDPHSETMEIENCNGYRPFKKIGDDNALIRTQFIRSNSRHLV
jgi:hypothetical protein